MITIVYHEGCLTPYFTSVAECPLRISSIHNKLKERYVTVAPSPASGDDIVRVHTPEHLERVQQEGIETYRTALLAAGGAICAAGLAFDKKTSFAVVRPPGHHAGRSRYGGFCFFNNIAVAVASLLKKGDIESAVIVDTDMHQGDGTQDIFSEDPAVSIVDIRANERTAYLEILEEKLGEIPRADILAVSAGFDLYVKDWGGLLETSDFQQIGYLLHKTALEKTGGRYFAVLEGGYFLESLARNALAFCQGFEGIRPFL
jgi:acetoin utilization deacetylase AcuC-like enzyme